MKGHAIGRIRRGLARHGGDRARGRRVGGSARRAAEGMQPPRGHGRDDGRPARRPRRGLTYNNAGIALWNMRLVSYSPKPAEFDSARGLTFINSDLAFGGNYVYQGNFAGFTIWDVSDPAKPVLLSTVVCATAQGDPSIYGNLLFISAEGGGTQRLRHEGRRRTEGPHARRPHLRRLRPAQSAAREERADLQRLAHAHDRSETPGQDA